MNSANSDAKNQNDTEEQNGLNSEEESWLE